MGLPRPILIKRINNELAKCSEYLEADIPRIPEGSEFPVRVEISLRNVPASMKEYGEVKQINDHRFVLILSEEYGYQKPEARWQTPIFHPNIMPPEEGGYVCLKTADAWVFGSTLLSFIKSVEQLVTCPNPKNPFGAESCMEASRYFLDNRTKIEISVSYGEE